MTGLLPPSAQGPEELRGPSVFWAQLISWKNHYTVGKKHNEDNKLTGVTGEQQGRMGGMGIYMNSQFSDGDKVTQEDSEGLGTGKQTVT